MIKKKILKYLPKKTVKPSGLNHIDTCYREYDVSELCIENQKLDYVDFIQKFIRWNVDCKTLKLVNLDLSRVQDQVKHVFDPQRSNLENLQTLHVENVNLNNKSMRRFLRSLRKMRWLKNLHLINMEELEPLMDVLAESIGKLQELKVLDVKNTK